MTSKNVYMDNLDDVVNKYNNRTINMKLVNIKSSTHIDFNKENNKEDPKFKVGHNIRISKYKNIFAKFFTSNCRKFCSKIKKSNFSN